MIEVEVLLAFMNNTWTTTFFKIPEGAVCLGNDAMIEWLMEQGKLEGFESLALAAIYHFSYDDLEEVEDE